MSLDLGGTSDGALVPGPVTATKNRTAMTMMARVLFRSLPATDTKIGDYVVGTSTTASRITMQWVSASPGQPRVGGRALDADPQRFLQSSFTFVVGVWTHVIGVIDYANSTGAIYIDGDLEIEGALSGAFGATQTANTDSLNGAIGIRPAGSQGMNGLIEDFRLYGRVIGAAEAKTIATSMGKDGIHDGLLHWYPLNDASSGDMAQAVCIAAAERIVATPLGTPVFAPGLVVPRQRHLSAGAR